MKYILYATRPNGAKLDKFPVDWRTLTVANAHDPAIWLDEPTARAKSAATKFPVGCVVSEGDGYWFLDIDGALQPDGNWSPIAGWLIEQLPGCYVEVSISGKGLHLIGRGAVPAHGTRNATYGLEFYTRGRFCALTGHYARGSMEQECPSIASVAATLFPPATGGAAAAGGAAPGEWTTEPCAEWAGYDDDDELLQRAMASQSARATFGGKPGFAELWRADEAALARAWPDAGGQGRPYDASAADAALAAHLAFWTGKDCERMERLMRRSALAREKWGREDYLHRTILGAAARARDVHRQGARAEPVSVAPPAAPADPAGTAQPTALASDLAGYFAGAVYIEEMYMAATPDGLLLSPQQFRASVRYGGRTFALRNDKTTTNAWEAFTESAVFRPQWANRACFRPELPPRSIFTETGLSYFNTWSPVETVAAEGDPGPFLDLMRRLLPIERDRDIILSYMAHNVQRPGHKAQWCPVLQGAQGNGKSFIMQVMAYCVGDRHTHTVNPQDIANKFNSWIAGKCLVIIEELYIGRDRLDMLDALKILITNSRIELQGKNANQISYDNRANFLAATNHADAIPKTDDDRRYCTLQTAQQSADDIIRDGMGGSYFPNLYAWGRAGGFAVCNWYLRQFAIPAEFDPAGLAHRAPLTSSTAAAIAASRDPVEQAVREAIESDERGFRAGWVSSFWLGDLLDRRKLRQRCPPNRWDALLSTIGYVRHPALSGGRVNVPVAPDGIKSRLWVLRESAASLLPDAVTVARAYAAAQGAEQPPPSLKVAG